MKHRFFSVAFILLIALGAMLWIVSESCIAQDAARQEYSPLRLCLADPKKKPVNLPAASEDKQSSSRPVMLNRADDRADSEGINGMFQADAQGNLVLNEKTRLNIEKLVLLNTPRELKANLKELSTQLPSTAHRQLVRLSNIFKNYTAAVIKKYPPGKELKTVREAMNQYDGVHALRVKHFGPEASTAFFGEEEKLSRRLLEIMSTLDESIPMPDRAHMAQEMLKKSMEANLKSTP